MCRFGFNGLIYFNINKNLDSLDYLLRKASTHEGVALGFNT